MLMFNVYLSFKALSRQGFISDMCYMVVNVYLVIKLLPIQSTTWSNLSLILLSIQYFIDITFNQYLFCYPNTGDLRSIKRRNRKLK